MLKSLQRQNNTLVMRDKDGKVISATVVPPDAPRKTWRAALKRLTNNGEDLLVVLHNIAQGVPYVAKHGDMQSEPIIPSPEVRRAAAVDLLHMLHGKPVAQTEVVNAEREAEEMEKYQAMSSEELLKAARPFIEASTRKLLKDTKDEEDAQ